VSFSAGACSLRFDGPVLGLRLSRHWSTTSWRPCLRNKLNRRPARWPGRHTRVDLGWTRSTSWSASTSHRSGRTPRSNGRHLPPACSNKDPHAVRPPPTEAKVGAGISRGRISHSTFKGRPPARRAPATGTIKIRDETSCPTCMWPCEVCPTAARYNRETPRGALQGQRTIAEVARTCRSRNAGPSSSNPITSIHRLSAGRWSRSAWAYVAAGGQPGRRRCPAVRRSA